VNEEDQESLLEDRNASNDNIELEFKEVNPFKKITIKDKSNHFKVFFEISNQADKTYLSLMALGPVSYIEMNNEYLYFIGYYLKEDQAETVLSRMLNRGYSNAKIFQFENGVIVDRNSKE